MEIFPSKIALDEEGNIWPSSIRPDALALAPLEKEIKS
jgi:hypothetical protein